MTFIRRNTLPQKELVPTDLLNLSVSMFLQKPDLKSDFNKVFRDPSISVYLAGGGKEHNTLDLIAVRDDGRMRCFNIQSDEHFAHIDSVTPIKKEELAEGSLAFYNELKTYVKEIKEEQSKENFTNSRPQQ